MEQEIQVPQKMAGSARIFRSQNQTLMYGLGSRILSETDLPRSADQTKQDEAPSIVSQS